MWLLLALTLTAHAEDNATTLAKAVHTKQVQKAVHATPAAALETQTGRSAPTFHKLQRTTEAVEVGGKAVRAQIATMDALLDKGLKQKTWYTATADTGPPPEDTDERLAASLSLLGDTRFTPTTEAVANKAAHGEEDWIYRRQAFSNWKLLTDASGQVTHAVRGLQEIHYGRGTWTEDVEVIMAFTDGVPTQIYQRSRSGTHLGDQYLLDLTWEDGALASIQQTRTYGGDTKETVTRSTLVPKA